MEIPFDQGPVLLSLPAAVGQPDEVLPLQVRLEDYGSDYGINYRWYSNMIGIVEDTLFDYTDVIMVNSKFTGTSINNV